MKFLAALGTVLFLLSLSAGSVGAVDGDAKSLLRSRKLPGNNNVFSNAECFKSDPNIPGSLLAPPPNAALQQALDDLLNELYTCVQASSGGSTVYCNVYFNPHTGKYGESVESRNTVTVWHITSANFISNHVPPVVYTSNSEQRTATTETLLPSVYFVANFATMALQRTAAILIYFPSPRQQARSWTIS